MVQVSHLLVRVRGSGQPSTDQGSVAQVSHLLIRVPWFRSVIYFSEFPG